MAGALSPSLTPCLLGLSLSEHLSISSPLAPDSGLIMPTRHLGSRLGRGKMLTYQNLHWIHRKCLDSGVSSDTYLLCDFGQVLLPL